MKLNVGVIFGGKTVEHEVSIITAIQAMNNIDTEKYDITPIYITKDNEWYTGGCLRYIDTFKDYDLIKRYAKRVNLINKDKIKNAKAKVKELYNWTKIAQDTHFSYQKAICETMAERQAKQIAQEKAAKLKKNKGEEKELSKLLEFRKRQAYA